VRRSGVSIVGDGTRDLEVLKLLRANKQEVNYGSGQILGQATWELGLLGTGRS